MKQTVASFLAEIVKLLGVEDAGIVVEIPENPQHGDYTTNIAMLLAGRLKAPPIKIAQQIVDLVIQHQKESGDEKADWLEKVEVAPPGFINLWLSAKHFSNKINLVLKEKEQYGKTLNLSPVKANGLSEKEKRVGISSSDVTREEKKKKSVKIEQNTLKEEAISKSVAEKNNKKRPLALFGKKVLVEFAHPNTHKAFHIGHLRNITTGEAMVRLLEAAGNSVTRVNYQGDVGMHIAKALYALLELSPYKEEVDSVQGIKSRVEFLGKAYAAGSKAFEEDETAQGIIKDINALIYASAQRFAREVGRNPGTTDYLTLVKRHVYPLERVYELWKETRQWSLDYFDTVYARVGTHYDRFYFESECLSGIDIAKEAVVQGVLKESDGAIVFDGKPHGIDTRVFANSLGLPTYEGKELALSRMETTEFGKVDKIIHVVGPEQASFFTVTFKAEELLGFVEPDTQHHLIYGWVKLKHGKMSSRTGNVVLGEWLLEEAKKEIYNILSKSNTKYSKDEADTIAEAGAIAAVKYAFLKVGTMQEIAFDLAESVSFEGDSGPYLLYTYARTQSLLRKAEGEITHFDQDELNEEERLVVRRIAQFDEVIKDAVSRFAPNTVCTYLFQLAQEFNALYAKHSILEAPHRVALAASVGQVVKNGLYLLGIPVVERM